MWKWIYFKFDNKGFKCRLPLTNLNQIKKSLQCTRGQFRILGQFTLDFPQIFSPAKGIYTYCCLSVCLFVRPGFLKSGLLRPCCNFFLFPLGVTMWSPLVVNPPIQCKIFLRRKVCWFTRAVEKASSIYFCIRVGNRCPVCEGVMYSFLACYHNLHVFEENL